MTRTPGVYHVDPVDPGVLPPRQLIGDLLGGAYDPAAGGGVGRELGGVAGLLVELGRRPPGLGLAVARYDVQALEELDVLRQAAVGRRARADVRGVVSDCGQAGERMKTASAFRAAKARSASDAPAWNSSGVRS